MPKTTKPVSDGEKTMKSSVTAATVMLGTITLR